jgi:uncharacterized cofD-like protein
MRNMGRRLLRHPAASSALMLLMPGLSLKRWLALGLIGLAAISFGIVFALELSLAPRLHSALGVLSLRDASPALRGGIFIGVGVVAAGAAVSGLVNSLATVWLRRRGFFLDSLYVERVLSGGPKVVAIGGGSGLPILLKGLKHYTSNITAIVTVADDGGSSGRLRSELGILPPGDIRNCLVALADSEVVMQQLMDYRFSTNGQLDGHSFGNILIAALAGIGGDFHKGVQAAGDLLGIRGRVVPSTIMDVTLVGRTVSGRRLIGESVVGGSLERLRSLTLAPPDAPAHPDAVTAINEADMIVLGPGSLFTSIVPNLLVKDIAAAVARAGALKMYVCNVASQPGETVGFSAMDHLDIIRHYAGPSSVDVVICNDNLPHQEGTDGLGIIPPGESWDDDSVHVLGDVIDEGSPSRHDSAKLARTIGEAYQKHRGKRRGLPLVRRVPQASPVAAVSNHAGTSSRPRR